MHPVVSSNLKAVGYNPAKQVLYVEFNSGSTYAYLDVPEKRALGLISAESKGSYFAEFIKDAYSFVKG